MSSQRGAIRFPGMSAAPSVRIRPLTPGSEHDIQELADLLVDCVEGGASVSFMLPLARTRALEFWRACAASAAAGERIVLVAEDDAGAILGTVQLIPAPVENQPHRADLAKMLVRRAARRRGIGDALLAAAEAHALAAGRTLLVLDTASEEAARLYARRGGQPCGRIPGYALWPDGRPCATTFFFKELSASLSRDV